MASILVSIICIAMIVVGGMTLSHGILTSTDTTALSVEEISVREGDIIRTGLDAVRAVQLSWSDLLRVTLTNTGQTKLASFDKWDLIVHYSDTGGVYYTKWLPYTTGNLSNNEWQKARIGLNGPVDFFEPGILNPGEELVILARLNPLPGENTTGEITVATPNGIYDSISFANLGYTLLTPYSENITLAGTRYYELAEANTADNAAMLFRAEFNNGETGRKILHNTDDSTRLAKHVFPLVGISEIPASNWTVDYRCSTWGGGQFPSIDGDVRFNINILVRKADGTLRTTIAAGVAEASLDKSEEGNWVNKSATYAFPGYTVVDENDYLEIDYYGETGLGPGGASGYLQLSVDDNNLPADEQTRIEA
jgi:hypothetical protein